MLDLRLLVKVTRPVIGNRYACLPVGRGVVTVTVIQIDLGGIFFYKGVPCQ